MAKGRWPTAWFAGAFHREADVELDLLHWKAGSPGAAAGEAFNRRMKQGYNDQGLWRASKSDSFASQLVVDERPTDTDAQAFGIPDTPMPAAERFPHHLRMDDGERAFLYQLVRDSYMRQAEMTYTQPAYLMMHIRLMQALRDIE